VDDDAVAERRRVDELQVGRLDALDEPLAAAGKNGEDPEVELIDESVRDQRPVELAGAELQDVLAGLLLELRDFLRDVAVDDRRVPRGLLKRP